MQRVTSVVIWASRLKVQYETDAGYCHFPIESDRGYDEEYFKGLTSEHKITRHTKGQARIVWEKRSSHARNEPLDLRNYATAALEIKCVGLPYDLLEFLAGQEENSTQNPAQTEQKAREENKIPEKKTVKYGAEQPVTKRRSNGGVQIW